MTKSFEKGLTQNDTKRKAELIEQLELRLGYVQYAVEKYNDLIGIANEFVDGISNKTRTYSDERSSDWHGTDRAQLYDQFGEKWSGFELKEINIEAFEEQLGEFGELPDSPDEV